MLSEKQISLANKHLSTETFTLDYKFHNVEVKFDYKIEIVGNGDVISMGDWTNCYLIEATIFNMNKFMELMAKEIEINETNLGLTLKYPIEDKVRKFLKMLDPSNECVILENFNFVFEKEKDIKNITESKKLRVPTRLVIQDIIEQLKKKKTGTFYLPEDEFYSFENFHTDFSVELTLKKTNQNTLPKLTGFYIPDEDVIEVLIIFNPENVEKHLYTIVGELNDIITHELTHLEQEYKGDLPQGEDNSSGLNYYTQPHELEAQYRGFKRLSKMQNKPFEEVVKNWFDTHKDIHGMNEKDSNVVINKIINFN
jgi:hypothetical protein